MAGRLRIRGTIDDECFFALAFCSGGQPARARPRLSRRRRLSRRPSRPPIRRRRPPRRPRTRRPKPRCGSGAARFRRHRRHRFPRRPSQRDGNQEEDSNRSSKRLRLKTSASCPITALANSSPAFPAFRRSAPRAAPTSSPSAASVRISRSTTLNGREQTTTNDFRAVEFDQFPSEILNQVVVYKTPAANLTSQGLVGTIDLRTIRPLDAGKRIIAIGARGSYVDQKLQPDFYNKGYRVYGTYVDQLRQWRCRCRPVSFVHERAISDERLEQLGLFQPQQHGFQPDLQRNEDVGRIQRP